MTAAWWHFLIYKLTHSLASECISMPAQASHNHPENNIGKHHDDYITTHTVFLNLFIWVCWDWNMGTDDGRAIPLKLASVE